jgi:MFS family permease
MFIVGSIFSQPLKKFLDRRIVIVLGSLFNVIGALLLGPSHFFDAPDKLYLVAIGCGFIGIGCACVFPNALPEICYQVNMVFKKNKEFNNNFAAGIFRLMQGFGQIAGPMLGTFMKEKIGFRSMTDVLAIVWLTYGILYFIFGGGMEALKNPTLKIE